MGTSAAAVLAANTTAAGESRKLRACVIGDTRQGGYGHSLHLAWAAREDVEVVALADPDEEGRGKHAAEARARKTYADYREMIETEKPDLVSIAPRWTIHHREYLLAAAACGAHGFMEKPISVDLAEADNMVRAIEEKNLRWSIAFNFRVIPVVQHAKRLIIDQGIVGDILELRGRGKEDDRAGGEDLLVLGTHIFDLMRFLVGSPLWCAANITVEGRPATRRDVHDATEPVGAVVGDRIHAAYGFANGVVGCFASSKNRDGNGGRWGLDIYGSRGVVSIRQNENANVYLLRDPSWAPGGKNLAWQPLPEAPSSEMKQPERERYAPIINDLIAAIQENRRPAVSLQDGRDSLEMVQAAYDAYLHGGRIEMPLKERTHPLKRWA
jgi:predicted dehydrogenase